MSTIGGQGSFRKAFRFIIILALMISIFVIDTITDLEIAASVFYIIAILLAIGQFQRANIVGLAGACIALTLLSSFLTTEGSREAGLINIAISVSAIVITTYLALKMVAAEAAVHEARAQLVRIARVTSLGELTASIAHEVNQPLAGLVTSGNACLRWLSQNPPNIDKARRSIERIIDDANRASQVIQRIRSLVRSETPKREVIDINETVAEAITLAKSEIERQGIILRTSLSATLPRVHADRIQFQQVIGNLLLNAIESMSGVPQARRSLEIASGMDGADMVVVSIADSGAGLSANAQNHLYEAFWTTKEGGTGIGLTISRSIIEGHGGRIWSGVNAPAGAIFYVSLPTCGDRM